MEVREIPIHVKGFGAPPTDAVVDIAVLSGADRLKRAGRTMGIALIVALIALPIPLVHFVLVPARRSWVVSPWPALGSPNRRSSSAP